jgi:hypothetical protein
MTKCPACGKPGGALNASPHCPYSVQSLGKSAPTCTWNKCKCGATYDRKTGNGYSASAHHPAEGETA